MLTKEQIDQSTEDFLADTFTVLREYIQLLFLNYFYQEKKTEEVYFKGGTCLRLIHNSPRFSEDLDFSTTLSVKEIKVLLDKVISKLQKECQGIKLNFVWQGQRSLRYRIQYQGKELKYPLSIRLDFVFEGPLLPTKVSPLKTKLPLHFFPLVIHLQEGEILAEKIRAFLMRVKGRDIFDLWYLLEKGVHLDLRILNKKLKTADCSFKINSLIRKINNYPLKKLQMDLNPFLPKDQRKIIPHLKEQVLKKDKVLIL